MHTPPLRLIGSLVAAAAIAALPAGSASAAPAAKPYVATQYKPKTKRDFTGLWENTQGIPWVPREPGKPPEPPPLTPAYQKIFDQRIQDAKEGKPSGDMTAACLPQGMPRIMTMTYPMEIMQNDIQLNIFAEWMEQTRRIFIDGRPHPPADELEPTYYGHSIGHWEGDVLVAETVAMREETDLEASGLPHSDVTVAKERIWLADDNTLKDEITLVDPKAYTHPWTVTKIYKRAPAGFTLLPYVCLENNRNPVNDKGQIGFVHQGGSDKP
ncbi:MAG TPA: hypothetical protein VL460_06285 [Caulobacteraceae bacterium]|jgi:hypothetical protein|nr:hypothetical protein [Caulobacteraceae bacterium]